MAEAKRGSWTRQVSFRFYTAPDRGSQALETGWGVPTQSPGRSSKAVLHLADRVPEALRNANAH
jgi:hypothetical protein